MFKNIKAFILTADKFEDMELFFPYFRLLEEGIDVDVAACKRGHIEGRTATASTFRKPLMRFSQMATIYC